MTFTLTLAWWWIPALITIVGVVWAVMLDEGDGYLSGVGNFIALLLALAVSGVAWAIAGFLK